MASTLPTCKVIAHVDLDAFYAQVEIQRDPDRLANRPVGVIQYNPWGDLRTLTPTDDRIMNDSNGSLIAVGYLARDAGVKRNHSGLEARKLCPDIQLVQVPTAHGKADLTIYRQAGKRVLDILARCSICERASIDECYLDLTEEAHRRLEAGAGVPPFPINSDQVHVYYPSNPQDVEVPQQEQGDGLGSEVGDIRQWWSRLPHEWGPGERLLAAGAAVVADLRQAVVTELGYTCSAGIAHTKLLAKLCSGLHKPAQQTVLPAAAVAGLLGPLPIPKLRALGGQFGQRIMTDLKIQTVGQLSSTPLPRVETLYGDKDARWLYYLARGIDDAEVEERKLAKSTSCGKTFRGTNALTDVPSVHKWLLELGAELEERLAADFETNNRVPKLLTVSIGVAGKQGSISRSCTLRRTTAAVMAEDAAGLVKRWAGEQPVGWHITDVFLAASNFQEVQGMAITKFFKPTSASSVPTSLIGDQGTGKVLQHQGESILEGPGVSGLPRQRSGGLLRGIKNTEATDKDESGPSRPYHTDKDDNGDDDLGSSGVDGASTSYRVPIQDIKGGGVPALQQHERQSQNPPILKTASGEVIDPAVLAALPPDIQKEVREQLKFEEMKGRLGQSAGNNNNSNKGGAGGKRPGSASASELPPGTQTLAAFLKGKRPKR